MFGNNSYMNVKAVERTTENGKTIMEVHLTSSKKGVDGKYATDFSSKYIRFVGKANNPDLVEGDRIKIIDCGIENCYKNKEGEMTFLKSPRYIVFDYEFVEHYEPKEKDKPKVKTVKEEELPF